LGWILVALWAALIFAISATPGANIPKVVTKVPDKAAHMVLYTPLGALAARAFGRARSWPKLWIAAAATGLATLYGISDELHQWFVPGRSCDWRDAVADSIGALIGAIAMGAWIGARR
jgi:VanZ family protein